MLRRAAASTRPSEDLPLLTPQPAFNKAYARIPARTSETGFLAAAKRTPSRSRRCTLDWRTPLTRAPVCAGTISLRSARQISTTNFGLTRTAADNLHSCGETAAHAFFTDPKQASYLNEFAK